MGFIAEMKILSLVYHNAKQQKIAQVDRLIKADKLMYLHVCKGSDTSYSFHKMIFCRLLYIQVVQHLHNHTQFLELA